MKRIPLTKGTFAIVDDSDYSFLMKWEWHALLGNTIYAARNSETVNGKRRHILMHRVICSTPKGMDTDHINGNGLDNRKGNLRVATRTQNMRNRKPNAKGKSKFKGVHWHKQHRKWCASIQVNKKRHHIGLFSNEQEAGFAYVSRAKKEFGEFFRDSL